MRNDCATSAVPPRWSSPSSCRCSSCSSSGIAEFGHAFQVQGTLSAAAREGVRLMALQNDPAAARAAVRNAAASLDPAITDAQIVITPGVLPGAQRRQHLGPPDHQLPDALPHRLLRLERGPDRNGSHAMQRLTLLRRRLDGERGATAVMLALLLVPMLGFAAIAVDVGALYAERARLQVAADAAAIAVAQDCSRGNCGDMLATAQALITANDGEGTAAQPGAQQRPAQRHRHRQHPAGALVRAGHRARLHRGLRDGDRRLGQPQRAAPPSSR